MRSRRVRTLMRRSMGITNWMRKLVAQLIQANKDIDTEVKAISAASRQAENQFAAAVRTLEAKKNATVSANAIMTKDLGEVQRQNTVTLEKFNEILGN